MRVSEHEHWTKIKLDNKHKEIRKIKKLTRNTWRETGKNEKR